MVFLESIIADSAGPVMYSPPGTTAPPHCTALGKVMLAALAAPELDQYVQRLSPLPARTPNSLTTAVALANEVARIQQKGYAVDCEEYHPGVRCVAAPVRDHTGRVIAALSVSSPVAQMPDERIACVAGRVTAAADAMSTDLGYVPTRGSQSAV
jgi:DNA-binding IclR family transcriptional regulator